MKNAYTVRWRFTLYEQKDIKIMEKRDGEASAGHYIIHSVQCFFCCESPVRLPPSGHSPENGQTMTNGKSRKYNKSRFWLGNGNPQGTHTHISRVLGFRVLVNFYPRPRIYTSVCILVYSCMPVCLCKTPFLSLKQDRKRTDGELPKPHRPPLIVHVRSRSSNSTTFSPPLPLFATAADAPTFPRLSYYTRGSL